jgi:hypothetical protein
VDAVVMVLRDRGHLARAWPGPAPLCANSRQGLSPGEPGQGGEDGGEHCGYGGEESESGEQ